MFSKVLVANRGEIAFRVINSLQEHGVSAALLVSPIDKNTLPAKQADTIIELPGDLPSESYLDQDLIINLAKEECIDAIHPGYGFLSENVEFRKKIDKAKIAYIGPTASNMEILGDKIQARQAAIDSGTPLLPGTVSSMDIGDLKEEAMNIGYPILIKAAAGGGGRGIRLVKSEKEFDSQADNAIAEAKMAFGDGRIYIEKYLTSGKHIEVQILGDGRGEVLHFFERDCSIQRKNQKLIEEGPAPSISREKASEIHSTAIGLTSYLKYLNAGTVEFMLDSKGNHYFLEVNTRIQVEHPVTEMITGEDLVWRQIQVAAGEDLNISQSDICYRGHAMEARIYAENPFRDFIPSTGTIQRISHPVGPGIRVDSHMVDNTSIPPFYDSMIAKLIAYGTDRDQSISRLNRALKSYQIRGIQTTIPYIRQILVLDDFKQCNYDTGYLQSHQSTFTIPKHLQTIAVAAASREFQVSGSAEMNEKVNIGSPWKRSLFPKVM